MVTLYERNRIHSYSFHLYINDDDDGQVIHWINQTKHYMCLYMMMIRLISNRNVHVCHHFISLCNCHFNYAKVCANIDITSVWGATRWFPTKSSWLLLLLCEEFTNLLVCVLSTILIISNDSSSPIRFCLSFIFFIAYHMMTILIAHWW